jgi:porin
MKSRALFRSCSYKPGAVLPGAVILLLIATGAAARAGSVDVENTPVIQKTETSLWNQQYLLGDWGGERTRLEQEGVTFQFNNIGDLLGDASGSQGHNLTYFGRFRASVDIDFQKSANIDGELFFSGIWQYGLNLSAQYLHTNTLTSSIAGENSVRVDQFWYQQGFDGGKIKIKLGQIAAVNEFGATDFFDILLNDELGYAPNAIFNTKQPFSPAGKPGVIVTGSLSDLTPGLYVKGGVFTSYKDPYTPDAYGVDYKDDFDHGLAACFELGYIEQKTDYNGVYKLGVNADPNVIYHNPATNQEYRGDFNAYLTIEKTVYHPVDRSGKMITDKGLDLLLELVGEPGDRNPLEYEVTAGGRYTGLIPGRDKDKIGFGVIFSKNGSAYSEASQAAGGPSLGGETTLELDYQWNPTAWLAIQADAQYIIDPGGISGRDDILVLGLRTIVEF